MTNTTPQRHYCELYDSYYDNQRNWLEKQCCDPWCSYCIPRPQLHPVDCKTCNNSSQEEQQTQQGEET